MSANPETHTCWKCGYSWEHGQHGGHSCSDRLLKALEESRKENEALRAELARLQAGAVVVPEPPDSDLPTANHAVVHQASRVGFRIGVKWARENARLVPAPPQPSADVVVVVPREECPECGSTLLEWGISHTTNSSSPDGRLRMNEIQTVAYLGCQKCSETVRTLDERGILDALRSSTNHDSKGDAMKRVSIRTDDDECVHFVNETGIGPSDATLCGLDASDGDPKLGIDVPIQSNRAVDCPACLRIVWACRRIPRRLLTRLNHDAQDAESAT